MISTFGKPQLSPASCSASVRRIQHLEKENVMVQGFLCPLKLRYWFELGSAALYAALLPVSTVLTLFNQNQRLQSEYVCTST